MEVHTYRVNSINSEGTSVSSSVGSTKPTHTTTPAAVTATAISPSQIKLTWLPPSDTFGQSISGYEIKREVAPGVYDPVGDTNKNTLSFIVSNLATDKTYSYAVSAKIGFGSTQESISASATPKIDSVRYIRRTNYINFCTRNNPYPTNKINCISCFVNSN